VRKGGLIFESLGVISGGDQHRGGCIGANPLHGHQFGRGLTNQSIKLLVELGDLLRERAAGSGAPPSAARTWWLPPPPKGSGQAETVRL
jgi:hypothetical protein